MRSFGSLGKKIRSGTGCSRVPGKYGGHVEHFRVRRGGVS